MTSSGSIRVVANPLRFPIRAATDPLRLPLKQGEGGSSTVLGEVRWGQVDAPVADVQLVNKET